MTDQKFNRLTALIRVPKTGSTSLIGSLQEVGINEKKSTTKELNELWVINNEQIYDIKPVDLEKHYVFATIRNPLTRFISGWRFCLRMKWIPEGLTPLDLLKTIRNGQESTLSREIYFHVVMPQSRWLFADGKLLCDNIIKFEQLGDIQHLVKYLGVDNFQLSHLKNSKNKYSTHPGTDCYYMIKYPRLSKLHRKVFEEDWHRLPYE